MAQRFLTNIDLTQNQIINAKFEVVGSDPGSNNFEGRMIYNSTEDTIKVYSGSAWRKMIHAVSSSTTALVSSESNGSVSLSIADVIAGGASGLMTGTDKSKLDNATASNTNSTLVIRDSNGRFQASEPSADLDVANKAYVDAARSGLDVKASVKYATNAALAGFTHSSGVLTATGNGAFSIDGAVFTSGDNGTRVLVKNETSSNAPYNGIYVVTDAGSAGTPWVLTRAADANADAEVTAGMFVFVEQGTAWADSGWVLTTDGTVSLGSTNLTFVQFSSAGQSIAGNGLTKTGNTIDVVGTSDRISVSSDAIDIASTYVGQSSITTLGTITTGTWNGTDVAVTAGGTGASTAADARANLAATAGHSLDAEPVLARVGHKTIGDGSNTSYTITHNFGTRDVVVQVYDTNASPTYETVHVDVVRTNTNTITVSFASAPASNSYRVVITG
jgi:hypothetical protein